MELFCENDGTFAVRAWSEPGRGGKERFRIRTSFRTNGERRSYTAETAEKAQAEARAVWRLHVEGRLTAPAPAPSTISALVDRYCERPDLSPVTIKSDGYMLRNFARHVGKDRRPSTIIRPMVEAWLNAQPLVESSRQGYFRRLRAFLNWAKKQGWIDALPTSGISIYVPVAAVRPWIDAEDWDRYLAACCGPSHRIRSEFVLETGLRASELVHARWSWITRTGHPSIRVQPEGSWAPKRNKCRGVPLSRRAQELLEDAKLRWGSEGYIFGHGDKAIDVRNLPRNTAKACEKAGIQPVSDFHGLRRSAGARWLMESLSILEVSRLLGHTNISTTARHYAGIADRDLAAAISRIGTQERPSNVVPLRSRSTGHKI